MRQDSNGIGAARRHFGQAAMGVARLYRAAVRIEEDTARRVLTHVRHFATISAGPENAPTADRVVPLALLLRYLDVQDASVAAAARGETFAPSAGGSGAASDADGVVHTAPASPRRADSGSSAASSRQPSRGAARVAADAAQDSAAPLLTAGAGSAPGSAVALPAPAPSFIRAGAGARVGARKLSRCGVTCGRRRTASESTRGVGRLVNADVIDELRAAAVAAVGGDEHRRDSEEVDGERAAMRSLALFERMRITRQDSEEAEHHRGGGVGGEDNDASDGRASDDEQDFGEFHSGFGATGPRATAARQPHALQRRWVRHKSDH
jgi:hypothetical protein